MKGQISFTVLGMPISQGSMGVNRRTGQLYHVKNAQLAVWRQKVQFGALNTARLAGWKLPLNCPLLLSVQFYLARPKHPKFKDYAATKPDVDKLLRAVQDGLSPRQGGKFTVEDSRFVDSHATKAYAASNTIGAKNGPRAEITVIDLSVPF